MKTIFHSFYYRLNMLLITLLIFSCSNISLAAGRDYYEIRKYRLKDSKQEERMDKFLKDAYLPALHRAGISNVGVFKPIKDDANTENFIIVFIPYKSLKQFEKLSEKIEADVKYQQTGDDYINAKYNNPPYERMERILLRAFSHMPQFHEPQHTTPPSERIYELRSYEGATEKIYRKKVEMFNEGGEIALFNKIGFEAVFYGEVILGSTMPNLMYMTTFSDKKTHAERWETFRNHPEWKVMSGLEQYKNTVSRNVKNLMYPTDYSDI